MKRRVISVRHLADAPLAWRVLDPDGPDPRDREARYGFKTVAIKVARQLARDIQKAGGLAQVRVFGRNGRIQTEWTYGRDPRRSKG